MEERASEQARSRIGSPPAHSLRSMELTSITRCEEAVLRAAPREGRTSGHPLSRPAAHVRDAADVEQRQPTDRLRNAGTRYHRHNPRHLLPRAAQHAGGRGSGPGGDAVLAGCSTVAVRGPRCLPRPCCTLQFLPAKGRKYSGPDKTRTRDLCRAKAATYCRGS